MTLGDYIGNFPEYLRDRVFSEFIKGKQLKAIMEHPEGKLIFEGVQDQMSADLRKIVELALADKPTESDRAKEMVEIGKRIQVRRELIGYVAGLVNKYLQHSEKIKSVTKE